MSEPAQCPDCGLEMTSLGALGDWCFGCKRFVNPPSPSSFTTKTAALALEEALEALVSDGDDVFTPGEVVAGRYRVVSLVGHGGMGNVYRADDLRVGQPVALKFLSRALVGDQMWLRRFVSEVRLARQISHPNVCRVYDVSDVDGRHYLSMEYIDGEDLASLLRRVGRLPVDKALDVTHQLCAGLSAAHDKGVLHLDLKPANVMIDGRGRAVITDFGIAVSTNEADGFPRAGTPAYMAPEQLAGRDLSVQTDLYALGLVLYEAFTGRRVFDAMSPQEPLRSTGMWEPVPPSHVVSGIDPSVERAIMACLRADASTRPRSAIHLAASLPGGDPVVAALAAGRVPSPDMIAATRREALRPAIAGTLAAALVTGVAVIAFLNRNVLREIAPRLSPPVLVARAQDTIRSLGYTQAPVDHAYWFTWKDSYEEQVSDRDPTLRLFAGDQTRTSRVLRFVYRESPVPLVAANTFGAILYSDPPAVVPGMIALNLDPEGRLLRFCAVPGTRRSLAGSSPRAVDWNPALDRAGLAATALVPLTPVRAPPVPYDTWAEWEWKQNGRVMPMRVTTAAYDGKPVYFDIRADEAPFHSARPGADQQTSSGMTSESPTFLILVIVTLLCAALLARRHVLRGQADRRGAWRLAVYVISTSVILVLLWADHVPDLGDEYFLIARNLAWGLYSAAFSAVLYLAFEPYVRRQWPDMLIGWNRVLTGRLSDPIVGRDVLVGTAAGTVLVLILWFAYAGQSSLNAAAVPPARPGLQSFQEPRHFAALLIAHHMNALGLALGALVLLLALHTVLRVAWLAVPAWMLAIMLPGLMAYWSDWRIGIPAGLAAAGISTVVLYRFGLVAVCAMWFTNDVLTRLPAALEFSTWYAGRSLFTVAVIVGIGLYGARTAVGGWSPGAISGRT